MYKITLKTALFATAITIILAMFAIAIGAHASSISGPPGPSTASPVPLSIGGTGTTTGGVTNGVEYYNGTNLTNGPATILASSTAFLTYLGQGAGVADIKTGIQNTGFGYNALNATNIGHDLTAVGYQALSKYNCNASLGQETAFGSGALQNETCAGANTAIGFAALQSETTGGEQTALGWRTLSAMNGGFANTGLGVANMVVATSSSQDNVSVGGDAMKNAGDMAPVNSNTAMGSNVMKFIDSGSSNVAIGTGAFSYYYNNASNNYNVALGTFSMFGTTTNGTATSSATHNIAIGSNSLFSYTTGGANVAIGTGAMQNATTSNNSVAIGEQSLQGATTGSSNVAVGYQSLWKNTTAQANVAIGNQALTTSVTGGFATAVGSGALGNSVATGNALNAAFGYLAGQGASGSTGTNNTAIGAQALQVFAGGSSNVAIGNQAGAGITGGSNNTVIGTCTNYAPCLRSATGSQNIFIGYDVGQPSASANGQLNIGNIIYGTNNTGFGDTPSTGQIGIATTSPWRTFSVVGTLSVNGLTTATSKNAVCIDPVTNEVVTAGNTTCITSSKYTKHDISTISDSTAQEIMALRPVTYMPNDETTARFGLIAEEAAKVDPRITETAQTDTTIDGHTFKKGDVIAVDYERTVGLVIAFVQHLQNQVTSIIARLDGAEARIKTLEAQVTKQQAEIDAINARLK
jgi:hypothetical protein